MASVPRPASASRRGFWLDFSPMREIRSTTGIGGVSQRALARSLGIPAQTIWRMENGLSVPRADLLVAIARKLGVPIHRLYVVVEEEG